MNGNTPTIVKILSQAGLAGIALAALWIVWNLASSHITHNTEVLIELKNEVRNSNEVTKDLSEVVSELKHVISK